MTIYFEFIEGQSLGKIISSGSFPSIEEARRWFTQIASALEHAHALGTVHRDVKPDNIIISADKSSAHLVDFGIALTASDAKRITDSGYVVGTPGYMSPEQMEGKDLDGAADMYSLGITLYETLCGHLPQAAHYNSLSDANEAIPPAIDDLIQGCLAPDKKLRVATSADFITKLRSAFRTDVPLSVLLTDARLHELHAALRGMSAEEFKDKPKGQKLLVINRVKDLMRSQAGQLLRPTAEMIALLVQLAIYEPQQQYKIIADAGFDWGFLKFYGDWQGDQTIRTSLISACKRASSQGHGVLSGAVLEFVNNQRIDEWAGWQRHDLRFVVMALLANPSSDEFADNLAELYDRINEISHKPTNGELFNGGV